VLGLARDSASMATDALSVIDDEAKIHIRIPAAWPKVKRIVLYEAFFSYPGQLIAVSLMQDK
jgi:hypothetical protein